MDDARKLLASGADKIAVNTPLFDDHDLVRQPGRSFGSQCVVGGIDYKLGPNSPVVMKANGSQAVDSSLEDTLKRVEQLGVGEVLLTSIDRDGTGQGYDLPDPCARCRRVPAFPSSRPAES